MILPDYITAGCENSWQNAMYTAVRKHYQLTCNPGFRNIKARVYRDGDGWAWEIRYTYDPQPER